MSAEVRNNPTVENQLVQFKQGLRNLLDKQKYLNTETTASIHCPVCRKDLDFHFKDDQTLIEEPLLDSFFKHHIQTCGATDFSLWIDAENYIVQKTPVPIPAKIEPLPQAQASQVQPGDRVEAGELASSPVEEKGEVREIEAEPREFAEGENQDRRGWIKLHRKLLDNPIFKDSEAVHLFNYFLLKANYEKKSFLFNKRPMVVERGQLITGLRQIHKDTGISTGKIRRRLELLATTQIITHQTTHQFSIVTICNYNEYQDRENESQHTELHTKRHNDEEKSVCSPQHSDDTATTTTKEVKEVKEGKRSGKKNPDPGVNSFLYWFKEEVARATGTPCKIDHGKDGKLIKGLLATYGQERLEGYVNDFLQDERCKRDGLEIGTFYKAINRIAQHHTENPLEAAKREIREREAKNGKCD